MTWEEYRVAGRAVAIAQLREDQFLTALRRRVWAETARR